MPISESSSRDERRGVREQGFLNTPHLSSLIPRASLVCVGSELLRGKINTHASTLARRLASVGIELYHEHTVTDDLEDLTDAIRRALAADSIVVVTGGLGPTFDDLSREAAAAAVGRNLIYVPKLFKEIFRKFKKARLRNMPPANGRQAYLIEGAEALANRVGTAPGQWLEIGSSSPAVVGRGSMDSPPVAAGNDGKKVLILLPGPPSELNPMVDEIVLPKLKKKFPPIPIAETHLHFIGVPESIVDQRLRPIIAREKGVQFTILAHLGFVDFDVFVSDRSKRRAERRLAIIAKKIQAKMGPAFYGRDDDYPLEKVIMKKFVSRGATLAVAESCTGGMLSKRLTDVPGSSDYFWGGVVSYSNRIKQSVLGVREETLRQYGAVSEPAAAEMAEGVRRQCRSSWGLSITGIAGPSGGTAKKPIGLVYIGISGPGRTKTFQFHFRGDRDTVRQRAVIGALDLLRETL